MKLTSSSIDLEVTREIVATFPLDGLFSIDMLSDDISATTTFSVYGSVGGTNYDVLQDSGSDITDTLVVDETKYLAVAGRPGDKVKIVFAGATTGNVTYNVRAI